MEDLIELYLFTNKKCPLPLIGTLEVRETGSVALYSQGKIEAPVHSIKFSDEHIPADDFTAFIALKKNINTAEALKLLQQYCSRLQNMDAFAETRLPHTGKFYVDTDGNLVFKPIEIQKSFLPDLTVERVIHPASSHMMVVGDKETTSTEMAAYYSDTAASSKNKWWIWAACLAIIAGVVLVIHFNNTKGVIATGNTQPVKLSPVFDTYRIAE